MRAYGYSIEQILVVDIIPDESVRRAMNEINAGMLFLEKNILCLVSFLWHYFFSIYVILKLFNEQLTGFSLLVYTKEKQRRFFW
jgi:hypothetical protein